MSPQVQTIEEFKVELTESEKYSLDLVSKQRQYQREQAKKATEILDERATLYEVLNGCPIISKFVTSGTETETGAQRKVLMIQKIVELYPRFAPIIKECQRIGKIKGHKSTLVELYNEAYRLEGKFLDSLDELDPCEAKYLEGDKVSRELIFKYTMLIIASGRYRRERDTGVIYERVNDFFFKLTYDNPEDFLTDIFANNPLYRAYSTAQNRNQLVNFIKRVDHKLFPFMQVDHNFVGYSNGILDLSTCEFTKTEDIGDRVVQVRKLFKCEFNPNALTPKFDAAMKYQFGDDQTIEDIMFLTGRSMTRIEDNFQIMVYQHGAGGSGKSILTELIKSTHGDNQVGTLSASHQDRFGLSEHVDKQLLICDDSSNLAKMLPKDDFLSMTSHGSIKCPVKGKASKDVDRWDLPLIINSNYAPNYNDESGEIARRLVVIRYHKLITEQMKNSNLLAEIKEEELGMIAYKMRSTYLKYCKMYKGKAVTTFLSEHFKKSRDEARSTSNATARFLTERCILDESSHIMVTDMTKELRAWCVDTFNKERSKEAINVVTMSLMEPKWEIKSIKLCRHCKGRHIKGCCGLYNRTERSSANVVTNIRYKTDEDMEVADDSDDEDEGIEFDA